MDLSGIGPSVPTIKLPFPAGAWQYKLQRPALQLASPVAGAPAHSYLAMTKIGILTLDANGNGVNLDIDDGSQDQAKVARLSGMAADMKVGFFGLLLTEHSVSDGIDGLPLTGMKAVIADNNGDHWDIKGDNGLFGTADRVA